jgi:hypothetical protein
MPRNGFLLWIVLLGLVASMALACGTPANSQHQILALAVSPLTADAQNYPNGEVPFIATGTYTSPPVTLTALAATWVVVDQSGSQTHECLDLGPRPGPMRLRSPRRLHRWRMGHVISRSAEIAL